MRLLLSIIVFSSIINVSNIYTQELELPGEQVSQSEAQLNFYNGLNLLNSGYVAESIVAFQRAISLYSFPLYEYYYSKANAAYGLNEASENIIRSLLSKDFSSSFLRSRLELLKFSKTSTSVTKSLNQLVRVNSTDLSQFGYSAPMNIRVLPNGNIAIVFLKTHEVIISAASGKKIFELTNGLRGVRNPTDVLYTQRNQFLVTSFVDDIIFEFNEFGAPLGNYLSFPENDNQDNSNMFIPIAQEFKGPQYMTEDDEGNLYVTTYGSAKVFKFTQNGEYLFHFGSPEGRFLGFSEPTGIEIIGEDLFVADYRLINNESNGLLYIFDKNGNYVDEVKVSNQRIETMRKQEDNSLLITVNKGLIKYDYYKKSIIEQLELAEFSKLISADFDQNNILWIVDQGRNRLESYSYLTGQYTGVDPKILSVNTDDFPNLSVTLSVKNAFGVPLLGIDKENFTIFENNSSIQSFDSVEEQTKENIIDNVIIIPSIDSMLDEQKRSRVLEVVNLLVSSSQAKLLNNEQQTNFWLLASDVIPAFLIEKSIFSNRIMNTLLEYTPQKSNNQYLPQSIRFGINALLSTPEQKTIVFIGKFPDAFKRNKQELLWNQVAQIMHYNHISFIWIDDDAQNTVIPTQFQKIFSLTEGGYKNHLDTDLLDMIKNISQEGVYTITYRSPLPNQAVQKYIPIEIETNFYNRSGKDIHGYIAPVLE